LVSWEKGRGGMFRRRLAIRSLMHNKNYFIIMAVYLGIKLRAIKHAVNNRGFIVFFKIEIR
jgi:hypothetical protein